MLSLLILFSKLMFILATIIIYSCICIKKKYINVILNFICIIAVIYLGLGLNDNVMYQIFYSTTTLSLSLVILMYNYKTFVHLKTDNN